MQKDCRPRVGNPQKRELFSMLFFPLISEVSTKTACHAGLRDLNLILGGFAMTGKNLLAKNAALQWDLEWTGGILGFSL